MKGKEGRGGGEGEGGIREERFGEGMGVRGVRRWVRLI